MTEIERVKQAIHDALFRSDSLDVVAQKAIEAMRDGTEASAAYWDRIKSKQP